MQDNKNFLGTEPVGKLLLKLSIPTVIAQLINMLYNIVDRIYIGHIPGEGSLALTGVGVCMPIIMIVSAFAALVSSGGAPRASIYMGKQDNKSAENILGNCFILQIIISVILTAILLIWGRDLLLAFGASENTISYATDYMHIYAFGTLFVQLTLGMNAFITAQGFTTFSMVSVLIGAVCNIVLDPVFIFVFHMGVRGAALATVISQAISTLWVVSFLCGKKTLLHLRKKHLHLEAKVVLPCIALGLAAFIMQSSESIVTVCFNSSLLRYGGDIAVGAMTILTSVMQFAMLPLQGIAQGAQPISSYNYGAKNADRVKKTFRLLLITCLSYSVLLCKTQRVGVCNACESVLVHKDVKDALLPVLAKRLQEKHVEIRADEAAYALIPGAVHATEEDWGKEYLDYILSIKVVSSVEEAIAHINKYNTKHSEAIITNNYEHAQKFLDEVDAAAVYVNASTRFTDGFEFGFGAEIGISTQKLHARGPMGLLALTTTKYIIYGNGQVRP